MKQWYKIVTYPLRSRPTVIEFTTIQGEFCSTVYDRGMQEMVATLEKEGRVESKVSPFSSENFREFINATAK